jgi:hypothetical protein
MVSGHSRFARPGALAHPRPRLTDGSPVLCWLVEAGAHPLSRRKMGDVLRGHVDGSAGGRVTTNARRVAPQCQRAEATQLDTIASNERAGDFTKETIDNALDFARVEVPKAGGQPENEFGSHHGIDALRGCRCLLRDWGHGQSNRFVYRAS